MTRMARRAFRLRTGVFGGEARRGIAVIACIFLVLAAAACANEEGVAGPQTYKVSVDTASPAGKNFQFASYFPSSLKVAAGDSIVFENESTQAPHTVTFGIAGDRANQPLPDLPSGGPNLAVLMPCYSAAAPTAKLSECPAKAAAEPPAYGGKGYWNSGFLVPAVAPSGPKSVTMKLDDSIQAGTYLYVCIIHKPMVASIEVTSQKADRDTPADARDRASKQIANGKAAAGSIAEPQAGLADGTLKALAGWGEGAVAVNRFLPEPIAIKTGTKVAWYALSAFEPHTVTFGSAWASGAEDPKAFPPAGLKSGSRYGGGLANSGIVRPRARQPIFELVFTKPGTYQYVCVLHPDMEGSVTVS